MSFGGFSILQLFVNVRTRHRIEWLWDPRGVPSWSPTMRERVRRDRSRGQRYSQAPVSSERGTELLALLAVLPASKPRIKRGGTEDTGPPLGSDRRRVSAGHLRWGDRAEVREREPAVFAAWSSQGVLRCVRRTRIGLATRPARGWRLVIRVRGRGWLVLCPCCSRWSGQRVGGNVEPKTGVTHGVW